MVDEQRVYALNVTVRTLLASRGLAFCVLYAGVSIGLWLWGTSTDSATPYILYFALNIPSCAMVLPLELLLGIPASALLPEQYVLPTWAFAIIFIGSTSAIQGAAVLSIYRYLRVRQSAKHVPAEPS